ncbi:hypothetical protein TTHERM_02334970, partial (macronuclear) [Tetrahymena thermophila SB210]
CQTCDILALRYSCAQIFCTLCTNTITTLNIRINNELRKQIWRRKDCKKRLLVLLVSSFVFEGVSNQLTNQSVSKQVIKKAIQQNNKQLTNLLTNEVTQLANHQVSEKRKSTKQSIFSKFLALSINKLSFYYKSSVKLVIFLHYAISVPKSFAPYAPILFSLQIQEQIMNQENKFGGERIVKKDCWFCQYLRLFLKEQVTKQLTKQV